VVRHIPYQGFLNKIFWLERLHEGTQQPFVDHLVFAVGNREPIEELLCGARKQRGQLWSFGTLCHSGASTTARTGANANATLKGQSGFWFVPL
jgi:hypothetical protein